MSLEALLAPIKAVDQEILRLYTGLTNRWEEKGGNKYHLALKADLACLAIGILTSPLAQETSNASMRGSGSPDLNLLEKTIYLVAPALPIIYGNNLFNGLYNILLNPEKSEGTELAADKYNYLTTKINRVARVGFMAGVLYSSFVLGKALITGEIHPWEEWGTISGGTLIYLSIASSMYIKDSNPKLLDKKPLLRNAWDKVKDTYHQAKEKIKAKIPEPQPVLYPVPTSHFGRY